MVEKSQQNTNRRLAQLFKRSRVDTSHIQNMTDDYKEGFDAGCVLGRDTQRKADIEVAKGLGI